MTTVHQVGYAKADPLETAYRTIDRLAAALDQAHRAVHANHFGPPAACREAICIDIMKASYRR